MYLLVIAYDTARVNRLEDQIDTLYRVITYALPLVTAIAIAILAAYYRIVGNVKRNTKNINTLANATNGTVTATKASIDALHRRLDDMGVEKGYLPNATSESSTNTSGGTPGPTTTVPPRTD